ncbi:uncharacterized protein LOC143011922 [Genypterus blacodes]|uniref:uncharacterized protein LOC143011922 n=1 Tax=Genypterus blacodes TaxID=154954 RepID=UPI003F760A42
MTSDATSRGLGCSAARFFFFFFSTYVLVLGLAAAQEAMPPSPPLPDAPVVTLRSLVAGTCQEIHSYAESVVGTGVLRSGVEFVEMVIRFLAEGAASGLNVIAVYVTEILRVTGFDVGLTLPRFTPEGVTAVAQWGVLALIGYWVLTIVLRLLIGVCQRVFWVVKTILSLWLFGLIATDTTASADVTAVRLAGLVLGCVLLSLVGCGSEKTITVENRLNRLEGRLKVVEKRKGEE